MQYFHFKQNKNQYTFHRRSNVRRQSFQIVSPKIYHVTQRRKKWFPAFSTRPRVFHQTPYPVPRDHVPRTPGPRTPYPGPAFST